MPAAPTTRLELDDIQSGVLRPRPSPYAASYVVSTMRGTAVKRCEG
jgi:hypothetical protein